MKISLHTGLPTLENEVAYTGYCRVDFSPEGTQFARSDGSPDVIASHFGVWMDGSLVTAGDVQPSIEIREGVAPLLCYFFGPLFTSERPEKSDLSS